jgi:hypothetical protein
MPLRHSSWKEHLLAKSNSVEGLTGNENFGSFPAATAKTTIQADALLKNLTEEGSVLLAATDDSKKITLLHQLKNFGGTRTRPINKIVALSGTTVDSKIFKIEPSSLLTFQTHLSPKEDELLNCKNKSEAEGCSVVDAAQYRIKVLPVVALPPLLVTLLLETGEEDPFELIHLFNKAAAKFDEARDDDSGANELLATKSIGYYLRWLWLVGKGEIRQLVELDEDEEGDEEVNTYLTSLRSEHILPPRRGLWLHTTHG